MARKKEMCSSKSNEPGAGIVLLKLEELHSFEGHPFKVERNQELFELSEEVYSTFFDIPETKMSEYYKPFSWLPHITLGKTLDKVQMQKAFQTMQEKFIPFTARFGEIGLAKVNPHEDVTKFTLL